MIHVQISVMKAWGGNLRVSSRLYDGSGSIKMILIKDIASRIVQKDLSELILLANQCNNNTNQFQTSVCKIKISDNIEVIEAVSEIISSYRKSGKLIVTDGQNLVFFPPNEEHNFADFITRRLRASDPLDQQECCRSKSDFLFLPIPSTGILRSICSILREVIDEKNQKIQRTMEFLLKADT